MPPLPHPQFPRIDEVELYVKQRHIKLPRLVRLVTNLRDDHTNASLRHEVYLLAEELYNSTLEDWIDELFTLGHLEWSHDKPNVADAPSVPQTVPGIPWAQPWAQLSPLPMSSIHFSTSRLYVRFVAYYELRCILSGCIQTICSIPAPHNATPPTAIFDLAATQAEDIHAASMIAACDNYAASDPSPMRMRPLKITVPALYSYGSWHRLELQAANGAAAATDPTSVLSQFPSLDSSDDASQHSDALDFRATLGAFVGDEADLVVTQARAMKSWVMSKLTWAECHWGGRSWRYADLDWLAVVLAAGGPGGNEGVSNTAEAAH